MSIFTKIILLILLSSLLESDIFDIGNFEKIDEKHLYLKSSKDIVDMKTVTYLVGVENQQIIKIFRGFADKLGKNNGAINLKYSTQKYFNYMKKSKCSRDELSKENQFILYEDREKNECIPFIINKEQEILDVLIKIETLVQNEEKLSNVKLEKTMKSIIEMTPLSDEAKKSLKQLVDYLLSS